MIQGDKYRPNLSKNPNLVRPSFSKTVGKQNSNFSLNIKINPNEISFLNGKSREQVIEISELKKQLLLEKSKNAELESKIEEINEFIREYELDKLDTITNQLTDFIDGVKDIDGFRSSIEQLNSMTSDGKTIENCGSINIVSDIKPLELCLESDGFTINGGTLRRYSNPLNALFLKCLNDKTLPTEIKEYFPKNTRIKLIDKTNKFTGKSHYTAPNDTNVFEPLTSPDPIGEGDGMLKIRFNSGSEQLIKVNNDTILSSVLQLLHDTIGFHGYCLQSPVNKQISLSISVEDAGLYPKGILLAKSI